MIADAVQGNLPVPREAAQAADDAKRYRMSQASKADGGKKGFTYTDHQGNRWVLPGNGILKAEITNADGSKDIIIKELRIE